MKYGITTTDTRIATALGTMGVPCKLNTTLVEATATRETVFSMGSKSVCGRHDTRRILSDFRSGKLEQAEPAHAFLTILRAIANRNAILDIQNKGISHVPRQVGDTCVWQMVRSNEGLPGCAGRGEVVKLDDLKMAAALVTCGFPLLAIDGGGHRHYYQLPRFGPVPAQGQPPLDAVELLTQWRKDMESIPWEKPFAQAARGLYNRERFLDAVNRDIELVLLLKPRSQRSALVRADATGKAFDQVRRHFDAG